jgi:hypothetical protein
MPRFGMQRKLARWDALFLATLFDQSFGEFGAFPHGHHPAGDIADKNIQDHVEVEIGPLHGSEQLGNVSTPELIGSRGQQFWFVVGPSICGWNRTDNLPAKNVEIFDYMLTYNRPQRAPLVASAMDNVNRIKQATSTSQPIDEYRRRL